MPPNKSHKNKNRQSERGNIFVFILLGVVLFAALSFTVARGFRSDTTSTMSARKAELVAADILDYAQQMSRSVDRLRRKGCSENEISFEHDATAIFTFSTREECKVFSSEGGNMKPWPLTESLNANQVFNTYRPFRVTSDYYVADAGSANSELMLMIGMVNETVCQKINDKINVTNTGGGLVYRPGSATQTAFTGTYNNSPGAFQRWAHAESDLEGIKTACVDYRDRNPTTGLQVFYHTLIER